MIFSPQVIWVLWYLWNWPQVFRRIRKLITDLKKREKYLVFTVVCDVSSRKITFFAQKHRLSLYEQLWWNYRSFTNFDHCMNNYGQVIGLSLMNCDCELWLWLWIVNSFVANVQNSCAILYWFIFIVLDNFWSFGCCGGVSNNCRLWTWTR